MKAGSFREVGGAEHLLVVDDQEANIQALGTILGKIGCNVVPATNGELALESFAARPPNLVLLDILMPGMDGFEVCRRIRENPEWTDIPVIFLSAPDDRHLIVRALENGGADYVSKPFSTPELLSRVRTHLTLKAARDHLKRLAQDREEMLGMLSHYLRNHLVGMHISAQVLLDHAQTGRNPGLRLMADNILSSSDRMLAFVKAFLANAAADEEMSIQPELVSLSDAAARAVNQHRSAAQMKQIKFQTSFPGGETLVNADPVALEQVLDNIVSNAVKFSPPGREVKVEVARNGAWLGCEVKDQGAGFNEQDKARLFRRYARLSARPTGGEPSTGLGLSVAKKLAAAMAGELHCQSEHGSGAAFTLRLRSATRKKAGED